MQNIQMKATVYEDCIPQILQGKPYFKGEVPPEGDDRVMKIDFCLGDSYESAGEIIKAIIGVKKNFHSI